MPYITLVEREVLDDEVDKLCVVLEEQGYNEGQVTYVLYKIVARWFKHIPKYKSIARIRGVLTGTMTEFDRRIAAPYEDEKIEDNGDVDLEYTHWGDLEYTHWDDLEDKTIYDECDCGRELLGVHLKGEHNGNS